MWTHLRCFLSEILRQERGAAIVYFALTMPVLIALAALALDGGNLWAYCASRNLDLPPPMNPPTKPFQPAFGIAGFTTGSGSIFQVQPTSGNCDPTRASTAHISGMLVGLADGSVRTLAPSLSGATWWAAATPAGGEVLGSDW